MACSRSKQVFSLCTANDFSVHVLMDVTLAGLLIIMHAYLALWRDEFAKPLL
jgi:hypothetical protein